MKLFSMMRIKPLELLDITLTARGNSNGAPIRCRRCPIMPAEGYLARLLKSAYQWAICEQLGISATSKGPVERKVVRVADSRHID